MLLVGEEDLNAVMVLGFVLIFVAVLCSETKFEFLRKNPEPALEKRVDRSDNPPRPAYNNPQA